jgi:hypothetical protein
MESIQPIPWRLLPGVKRLGLEADHSPPTIAEVKKLAVHTFTGQMSRLRK